MSQYWKSIDKIYCNFCKIWYQDNKPSRDFHEKGIKHKNNVRRYVFEMQKNTIQKKKDQEQFDYEMKKIEQAALNAFQKDIVKNPSLIQTFVSKNNLKFTKDETFLKDLNQEKLNSGRFGDEDNSKSRKEALDYITNKLKRKSEWFESKTLEGKIYYYNKVTSDVKWKPPKCGFISLEEQAKSDATNVCYNLNKNSTSFSTNSTYIKHEQFGKWKTVQPIELSPKIDLELPKTKIKKIEVNKNNKEDEIYEFKEKVLNCNISNKKTQFSFKKRKLTDNKCIRIKEEN